MAETYGMLHPHSITADYDSIKDVCWLTFTATNGDRMKVGLSGDQAQAMAGLRSRDPHSMARDLYIGGHIEVDELEERLSR